MVVSGIHPLLSIPCPLSIFSKDFFSKTTGAISIKIHKQPSGKGGGGCGGWGEKVYIFGPGRVTKVATMAIYGKTLKNLLL